MVYQDTIKITQDGNGVFEITDLIAATIKESKIKTGSCHVFSQSSSSSILIGDTANASTKKGTADFLATLAPNDESVLENINQAMNTLPKNLHYIIQRTSINIPVTNAKPGIGVWQGIYFHKYDQTKKHKKLTVTVTGE